MFNRSMLPLVFVFLILGTVILLFRNYLQQRGMDWQVLSGGNLIIYVITIISLHLLSKGMKAESNHAFLRQAYSGIFLKLIALAVTAAIYIAAAGDKLNKPAIFACMALYFIYSFVERSIIVTESKRKRNG